MTARVKGFILSAFTENLGVKLVAFIIAATIFIIIRVGEKVERKVFVDVVVQMPDRTSGKVVVGNILDRVKLTVRGPRSLMNTMLKPGSVRPVVVDLRSFSGGTYYFDEAMFQVPTGFDVVQISPSSMEVTVDDLKEKQVEVVPRILGEVASDFRLIQPFEVKPTHLGVIGPSGTLHSLTEIETDLIPVSGLTEGTYIRRVHVKTSSPDLEIVPGTEVEVKFSVKPLLLERLIQGLQVKMVGSGDSPAALTPPEVAVRLSGTRKDLDAVKPEVLFVFVEIAAGEEGKPGRYRKEVKVTSLPHGVELKGAEPPFVVVRISRK